MKERKCRRENAREVESKRSKKREEEVREGEGEKGERSNAR